MEMFILPKRGTASLDEYISLCYREAVRQGHNPFNDNFCEFNIQMARAVGGTVYALTVPNRKIKIPADDGSCSTYREHTILEVGTRVYDPEHREKSLTEVEYLNAIKDINYDYLVRWVAEGSTQK